MKKRISASILSADFAKLGEDTENVIAAGADAIHFDVMDHHFVPNLSFGPIPCEALRNYGITTEIDVHLMVDAPEKYIEPFAKAGATRLTFHPETVRDLENTLQAVREAGLEVGLSFNPDKAVSISDEILASLDLILMMSVFPGFGGQRFIEGTLGKISEVRARIDKLNASTILAVDGGIKVENIGAISKAGADYFVVGSGLFAADDYQQRINELRKEIENE